MLFFPTILYRKIIYLKKIREKQIKFREKPEKSKKSPEKSKKSPEKSPEKSAAEEEQEAMPSSEASHPLKASACVGRPACQSVVQTACMVNVLCETAATPTAATLK